MKSLINMKGFANLSQFSEATEFNRVTLHNYLKGKGPLSENYYELCKNLEVDPLELLSPTFPGKSSQPLDEIAPLVKSISEGYPDLACGLFGSRARGKFEKYSDWDLGVTGGVRGLSTKDYLSLKNRFDDMAEDLPRTVDLINLDQAPPWFLDAIDYKPLYLGGNKASWNFFLGMLHGIKKRK